MELDLLFIVGIFSTIIFVQECLKKIWETGDKIVPYREKDEKEKDQAESNTAMKKSWYSNLKGIEIHTRICCYNPKISFSVEHPVQESLILQKKSQQIL